MSCKRLVYGGQKGLDSHIARLEKTGWHVVKQRVETWPSGKKIYIAELIKATKQ